MKTTLTAIFLALILFNVSFAQKGFKNNGAKIIVSSGGIINITGGASADFINASSGGFDGRIDLDGKIKLEGDWSNSATSGSVFINVDTDGEVEFKGTTTHSISGNQTDFEKLTLNTTGDVTLSTSITASGNLTLTSGLLILGTNNLTLGVSSAISGTPTATNMVVASSTGELRKSFSGTGSFTYPIGDNTSTVEYSPITLNFTSGTFGGSAYAGTRVTNSKHPQNTSVTGYINRYWSLSQSNISSFSCNLSSTYTTADIFGTESLLFSGYYSTPNWVKLAAVNTASNLLTGTISALNPITAGDQAMFCTSTITINESITNVACYGNSTGAVNVTVTGGYGSYTYNWSGTGVVVAQEDQTGLTSGTYNLTVTDQNGCTQTDLFTISQPSQALSLSSTQTNVSCYGNSTGAIDLTVSGGTPSYIYSWSNSATSQDLNSIAAGTYSVTVTDANSCTASTSATITQPASALSIAVTSQTNISCFGGNNGAIDITVSGGTSSYTYNWGSGITSEDRSSLIAGTYTVTATDANSCTATKTVTITQPAAGLSVSVTSQTNISCYGGNDGAINITATGGTSPYTYNWVGGITTEDRIALASGTYSVTVTDANSCTSTASATITQPSAALAVVVTSQTNVSCFGGSNGAINITATGGTTPYSYNWGSGVTSEDRTNILAGTYSVTVTDNKFCLFTVSATITEPADLSIVTSATDATCNGNNDGSASVVASGGTSTYTYAWDDDAFQTTSTASNLIAGTYNITVTDSNGCTEIGSTTVNQPTLIVLTPSSTQASCGLSDGSASVSATGGSGSYIYNWSPDGFNGDGTVTYSSLPTGTYLVSVTDSDNCSVSINVNVSESGAPTASITSQTNINCNGGNNGSATVTATGGTPGYTYLWTGGQTTATATNLTAGTYNVTVKDNDGLGCSATASVTITQPSVLNASITSSTNVSCNGGNNGSATVTASGGSLPYSYSWSNGSLISSISSVIAGTYSVTVTDAQACTKNTSVTIAQPVASLDYSVVSTQNVNCFGGNDGSLDISVFGGTSPYTYNWSTGSTNQDISSLTAGDYDVTITDANSCTKGGTSSITQPVVALSSSISSTNVNCFNGTDGTVSISVSGGTTPYTYLWSNSATSQNLSGVGAGSYSVTIKDANNCETTESATINQPSESLTASAVKTNVNCFGNSTGSIDVTVAGGTPSYTYSWSNLATTQDISNVVAGTYTITVTDSNGCVAVVSEIISQPSAALSVSEVVANVSCFNGSNGSIDVTVSGGTMPYSYVWSDATTNQDLYSLTDGTYLLTITDVNNCQSTASYSITEPTQLTLSLTGTNVSCYGGTNGSVSATVSGGVTNYTYLWNNNVTTQNQASIYAGIHTLTVTDANGCTISDNYTVNQPTELVTSSVVTNISCYNAGNGSINLTVVGGTTPYAFYWDNTATTQNLSGLSSGSYSYTVTDNLGCTNFGTEVITQPSEIILDVLAFNATCGNSNGEAIVSVVSGGVSPFNYSWSNGAATASINSLTNGVYYVSVTDNTGCIAIDSATINITYPPTVSISSSTNATCFGTCNGNATVLITGGQTPYSILWSDASSQTSTTANNLCAGSYSVTVSDGNSCSANTSVTISQPTDISIASSASDVTCYSVCNGGAMLTVSGGVSPYSYLWNDPSAQTSSDASNLCAGNFNYSVTDTNGCLKTGSVIVGTPAQLIASANVTDVTCNSGSNGSIDLSVSGGISPFTYTWSNSATTQDLTGLSAGNFDVTVTDASLCTTSTSVTVTEPSVLVPTISGTLSYCAGSNTTLDAGAYSSYLWSNDSTTQTIAATSGTYIVTVTNSNGCTGVSSNVVVIENALPTPTITGTMSYCAGSNTTLDAGVFATYIWSSGETTQTINVIAGTHSVTVTNSNGCIGTSSTVVVENPLPTPSISGNLSYCAGSSTTLDAGSFSTYLWSTTESTPTITATAGNYSVTVTDVNGCSAIATASVIENTLPTPSITGSLTYCTGFNTTLSTSLAYGSYLWSNGSSTQIISATTANNPITVTVTDLNGCSGVSSSVNVSESTNLNPTISGNLSYCEGSNTSLDAGAYATYTWSTTATTQTIVATAGTYDVTVADVNGCSGTASVVVIENANPTTTITGILSYCAGSSTTLDAGSFSAYSWSNGETTQTVNATSGTYNVTVTNTNGCFGSASVVVTENTLPTPVISGLLSYCEGSNTTLSTTIYDSYLWSNGETTQSISATSGFNTVTVTDVNGCSGTASVDVIENALPVPSITGNLSYCEGSNTTLNAGSFASYLWSTGETTQSIIATSGSYSVTVTDVNGCSGATSVTVIENAMPTPSITGNLSYCAGFNTILNAGFYTTYSWSTGETTQKITVTAGTYSVTVADAIGCSGTSSDVVVIENSVPTASIIGTNITCNSQANGIANLTVSGGTTPYSFMWNNAVTTEDLSGLSANAYSVVVTDINGCNTSASVTISEPSAIILSSVIVPESAGNDGSIDVTVIGGTTPYTYIWSNLATTEDLSGLTAGFYNLTVTDANGCTQTQTFNVTNTSCTLSSSISSTDVSCFGLADGTADLTVSGGITPYTFSWDNGATTEDLTALVAGSYIVTITDNSGCNLLNNVDIATPSEIMVSSSLTNVSCHEGNNGKIELTVSGGTTPYTFIWSSGEITEDISGLSAGIYSGTLTDANGCSDSGSSTITEPFAISISAVVVPESIGNDGSIDVTVTGGTTPYSFAWDNSATTEDLSGLTAGTYFLYLTDINGCSESELFVVNNVPCTLTSSLTQTDVSCFGLSNGSIDLIVLDGVSPYTFNWSTSATSEDISGLNAGTYDVTITDNAGCTTSNSVTISSPSEILVSVIGTDVSCNGGNNGTVDLTVSGGTAPYFYNWDNGSVTQDLTGLSAATYIVTVTDGNMCQVSTSVSISEPTAINTSVISNNVSCFGVTNGEIDLTVSGGTAPYTFSWDNGSVTQDLTGLSAATYNVTVTDNNMCQVSTSVSISEPTAINSSATSTDVTCFGGNNGAIDLTVSGGTTPYTYAWDNGSTTQDLSGLVAGVYSGVLTDANGCTDAGSITITEPSAIAISGVTTPSTSSDGAIDVTVSGGTTPYSYAWDNSATTEDLSSLAFGYYNLTVTDGNSCTASETFYVGDASCTLAASIVGTDISCFGLADGSADLTVSGGTSPYFYNWSTLGTTEDISGLVTGSYDVTITDNAGCIVLNSVTISSPSDMLASAIVTDVTCNGGTNGAIDLTVTGGTTPYGFAWSNLATTEDISGLSVSVNDVTITDNNMCQITTSVSISEPTAINTSATSTDVTCNGVNNGTIDITVSGGTTPYTYSWDNGSTTQDLSGLVAGVYSGTLTDANGCTETGSITISEPSAIAISAVVFPATSSDGAIDVTVSGGTTPYSYAWDNSATTEDLSGLAFGYYYLTVTDGNGCTANEAFYVNDAICTLAAGIVGTDASCFGLADGSADLTVSGGTSPYTYSWSTTESTQDISGLVAGNYEVTVSDAGSCVEIVSVTINQPTAITLTLSSTDDQDQSANGDGTATVIATGGTSPYTYVWDDALAQATSTATNLNADFYNVTVTDSNGCTATDTITVKLYIGITNVNSYLTASIYPNPAKDVLNILISTSKTLEVDFVIYDAIGQVVYNNKVSTVNGNNLFNVDLSNEADGIYFIKFNNTVNNQLIRFVKSGN